MRTRLLLAVLLILALVLLVVTGLTLRVTHDEFNRYLVRERGQSQTQLARALPAHYQQQGSWNVVTPLLQSLSRSAGRPLLLLDANDKIIAASRAELLEASVARHRPGGASLRFEIHRADLQLKLENPTEIVLHNGARKIGSVIVLPPLPGENEIERRYAVSVRRGIIAAVAITGLVAALLVLATAARLTGFNSMIQALTTNEKVRRSMVSDVAHELRTPLTNMRCAIEAVEDGVVALDRQVIDSLHAEVRMLTRLVDDLQELALADAGQLRIERSDVNVRELLHSVAQPARVEAADDLMVHADPDRLRQMIRNLVDNAARHTPDGDSIILRAWREGSEVILSVIDRGSGIAPDHLPHVFDRFYRADASRSRDTGGSGLGLAIVKALAKAHGGDVSAVSEVGKGSAFTIRLPG